LFFLKTLAAGRAPAVTGDAAVKASAWRQQRYRRFPRGACIQSTAVQRGLGRKAESRENLTPGLPEGRRGWFSKEEAH